MIPTAEKILDSSIYNLSQLIRKLGNNIVFQKLNLPLEEITFEDEIVSELLEIYIAKYSKDRQNESIIIDNFKNYLQQSEYTLEELQDFYNTVLSVFTFINDTINNMRREKIKDFKTLDIFILSNSDYNVLKQKVAESIQSYLESFIKIRGDYIGEDTKHKILQILDYLKNGKSTQNIKEIDENLSEIITRMQDYEYYIICKDRIFTIVPSSYIWFEFFMHIYYLNENEININSFKELYEKRIKPSFDASKSWYQELYKVVLCRKNMKDLIFNEINYKIQEIQNYIEDVYQKVESKYPDKVEIDDQTFSQMLYWLHDKTQEFQKLSKKIDSKKLKGTGFFENFYTLIKDVYSEKQSLLVLHDFHNSIVSIISQLENQDPEFLTPIDRKVIENREKFEHLLDLIDKYLHDQNKDYLIDVLEYFETDIEPTIVEIKTEYIKLEKLLLESEKVKCIQCGYEENPENDYCSKCGSKLIKPQREQKTGIKNIYSKLAKAINTQEVSSYAIILINLTNNSILSLENIKSSIESIDQAQKDKTVQDILNKINIIIDDLVFLREKASLLANNQVSPEETEELILSLEPVVEEIEQNTNDLYSQVRSIIQTS
ncbi:MAG: zinc ribbon domain-containing protein [bacterium]